MKKLIGLFFVCLLLFLSACGPDLGSRPVSVKSVGKVVSVSYLQGSWAADSKTIITLEDGSIFVVLYSHSVKIGQEMELVIRDDIDCLEAVGGNQIVNGDCWSIFK
jgi:hypothetical protein